jgi:hypothetical protein
MHSYWISNCSGLVNLAGLSSTSTDVMSTGHAIKAARSPFHACRADYAAWRLLEERLMLCMLGVQNRSNEQLLQLK